MTLSLKVAFGTSVCLVLYTFLVYPVALLLLAGARQLWDDLRFAITRRERRPAPPAMGRDSFRFAGLCRPQNEEPVMAEKMRDCAELEYPPERLEILVECDACTDQTAEVARTAGLPNLQVFEFAERSGKPQILNRLTPQAQGEIVVFSDANTLFEAGGVRSLVRQFADPQVGCVCGELRD